MEAPRGMRRRAGFEASLAVGAGIAWTASVVRLSNELLDVLLEETYPE